MRHSLKSGLTTIVATAALLLLAGCAEQEATAPEPPPRQTQSPEIGPELAASGLLGEEWRVTGYADGPALKGVYNTIAFNPDGSAGGRAACNAWRGPVEVGAMAMQFGNAISTMMACPESAMIAERRFLTTLPMVRGYRVENGVLTLTDGSDAMVMQLKRGPWPKGLDDLPEDRATQ